MLLQHRYLCKFPASSRLCFHRPLQNSLHGVALAVLRGGQELLSLKVAPIQPSVTAAFHLQSRRDKDCQMWEFTMLWRLMYAYVKIKLFIAVKLWLLARIYFNEHCVVHDYGLSVMVLCCLVLMYIPQSSSWSIAWKVGAQYYSTVGVGV